MEVKMKYGFAMSTKRFIIVAISLMIIFLTVMALIWYYLEEVSNSPCAVCANRLGETVTCSSPEYSNILLYHPNYSTEEKNYPIGVP